MLCLELLNSALKMPIIFKGRETAPEETRRVFLHLCIVKLRLYGVHFECKDCFSEHFADEKEAAYSLHFAVLNLLLSVLLPLDEYI